MAAVAVRPFDGPAVIPQTSPAVELTATALIMGGTGQTLSIPPATEQYIRNFVVDRNREYIAPTGLCVGGDAGCTLVAVYGPNELAPFTGIGGMTFDQSVAAGAANLDACIRGAMCILTAAPFTDTNTARLSDTSYVVSGGSQGAIIAGREKAGLIAHPAEGETVSFVINSNPSRPNGGMFTRFPGGAMEAIGITFTPPTPTDSPREAPMFTVDIARQYDGWDDFPLNPLNLLATANAALGTIYLHAQDIYADGPAKLQGYFQDTTYYLTPTAVLPLLQPLAEVPLIGMPMVKLLDAPLRVLIETGYDRTINPGQPSPAQYLYVPNPIDTAVNFAVAIPTGWDDAIAYVTDNPKNRPFNTSVPGPYGVGGPPVYTGAVDPYQDGVGSSVADVASSAKVSRTSETASQPKRSVAAAVAAATTTQSKSPARSSHAGNRAPRG